MGAIKQPSTVTTEAQKAQRISHTEDVLADLTIVSDILLTKEFPKGIYIHLAKKYHISRERIRQIAKKHHFSVANEPELITAHCQICHKPFKTYKKGNATRVNCDEHIYYRKKIKFNQRKYYITVQELYTFFPDGIITPKLFREKQIWLQTTPQQINTIFIFWMYMGIIKKIGQGVYKIQGEKT